jgi:hypothetical protein
MKDILFQISEANKSGYYYVALFAALTIPDICGALESSDGKASKNRYIDWYDRNINPSLAKGKDIYNFRCSLLHQGRSIHPSSNFSRIIFIEPGASTNIFHNCFVGDALLIDVQLFVIEILSATEHWLTLNENTEIFKTNFINFISRHPNGLLPYIAGRPVIG